MSATDFSLGRFVRPQHEDSSPVKQHPCQLKNQSTASIRFTTHSTRERITRAGEVTMTLPKLWRWRQLIARMQKLYNRAKGCSSMFTVPSTDWCCTKSPTKKDYSHKVGKKCSAQLEQHELVKLPPLAFVYFLIVSYLKLKRFLSVNCV